MEPIDEIDLRYKTLHAIHESAADAIFSVNELGVVNTVNPAAECLFGYGKTELVGQDIFVLIPSLSCEQTERGLARVDELRAVAAGTGLELTALNKEGSSLFIDVTVREMRTDGEQSFAVFVRKRAHSQYAGEQTESLGRIIEESFNETYILDALDLKFVFVNLAARNNLGYSTSELAEMTPVDINPSFSMDAFQELVKPLLQGATESLQFETEHVRKNGSPYEVMVNLQRSSFLSRSVFVATVLDVTEHKLAERRVNQQQAEMQDELKRQVALKTEELRRAQDQLMRSEKFSTLGKVAGGIAHEIRNPLNAVKTSAYFLLNAKNPSTEKVREHLERIDRQVSTVDNVITALADVAIMPEANLRPVAIEPLLRTVVSSLRLPEILDVVFFKACGEQSFMWMIGLLPALLTQSPD